MTGNYQLVYIITPKNEGNYRDTGVSKNYNTKLVTLTFLFI